MFQDDIEPTVFLRLKVGARLCLTLPTPIPRLRRLTEAAMVVVTDGYNEQH